MSTTVTLGIDLGFGRVKVAGQGFRVSFPAVVAEPGADSEPSGMVEYGGERFLVGAPALLEKHHRYPARADKILTRDEQAKFRVALALAARHYDTDLFRVVTGLPPAHYKEPAYRTQLQDQMTGVFEFAYEGRLYGVHVAGVTVDPQAGAAMFDHLVHDDGGVILPERLDQRYVVVDIGHLSSDIALMHGRKAARGAKSITSVERAVWTVYEECAQLLRQKFRLAKTAAEIDAAYRGDGIRLNGELIPLPDLIRQAAVPVARSLVTDILRHAGDIREWDVVLLVGGGAGLFYQTLAQELGRPVMVPPQPEYANACGYFKRQIARW